MMRGYISYIQCNCKCNGEMCLRKKITKYLNFLTFHTMPSPHALLCLNFLTFLILPYLVSLRLNQSCLDILYLLSISFPFLSFPYFLLLITLFLCFAYPFVSFFSLYQLTLPFLPTLNYLDYLRSLLCHAYLSLCQYAQCMCSWTVFPQGL